jgi:F-type H+-transporting ATPase subunit epsilon
VRTAPSRCWSIHIDYVAALVEGILTYRTGRADEGARGGQRAERYVAIDGGVVVKRGNEVVVSTPNAVQGDRLEDLERSVEGLFRTSGKRERDARAVLVRLETDLVQRMLELEENRA